MPTAVAAIQRQHVDAFMNELHARTKPATASNRFRALQQFFKFAVEEEEINRSPMERMHRPAVPVEPVPVLSTDDLRALLAACAGKHFEDKRDTAIVRLFVDTGMRRAELLGLRVTEIDFDQDVTLVIGKGSKGRACPFGSKTGLALGRSASPRRRSTSSGTPGSCHGEVRRQRLVRRPRALAALNASPVKYAFLAASARRCRSAGESRPSGWTCRSNRAMNASLGRRRCRARRSGRRPRCPGPGDLADASTAAGGRPVLRPLWRQERNSRGEVDELFDGYGLLTGNGVERLADGQLRAP